MHNSTFVKLAVAGVLAGSMAAANAGTISLTSDQASYNVGDTVTITYTMDFSSDPTIGGGTDFTYQDALLDYVSWDFDAGFTARDTAFDRTPDDCTVSADPNCATTGEVNGLGWGNFGGISGPAVVGTLTFTAIDVGTVWLTGSESEDAPPSNPGPFYDTDGNRNVVSFVDAHFDIVAAQVPVPAAAWLMISGLAGLFGFGRRRA